MILYRIYTEDVNRERIKQKAFEDLNSFTFLTGTGYWRGAREDCLIIEILGGESNREDVLRLASWIKTHNKQDSVIVTEQVVKTFFIGESL